jgi:hypothetical protein
MLDRSHTQFLIAILPGVISFRYHPLSIQKSLQPAIYRQFRDILRPALPLEFLGQKETPTLRSVISIRREKGVKTTRILDQEWSGVRSLQMGSLHYLMAN